MITLITAIHISAIVLLVIVVLLQSGKGAEISASFGGSSQTVFGSSGGANFFTRLTAILAATFMITSITLTLLQSHESRTSVFEGATLPAAKPVSAAPVSAAPAQTENQAAQSAPAQQPAEAAAPIQKK